MADHSSKPQNPLMGGMGIGDMGMGGILKTSLEQEYKDLLLDFEDLPREAKIPKDIHGDVFGKSASEMMKANNRKFIAALEGLLKDINNYEKEGKSPEEILKYVRQIMLSSRKVP